MLGRLVARGLHDELQGSAYAIVDGIDGRTHHLRFSDLEMTGDAKPGAIVEARVYQDSSGRTRLSLATRSDLTIRAQVSALGATWIDRQLLAREPVTGGGGFGAEVREAMDRRVDHLVAEGLAGRQRPRIVFARDLLDTLRRRELAEAASRLSDQTGLAHNPSAEGEHVSGVYRQRVALASGRFALIDDGLDFPACPLAAGPRTAPRQAGRRRDDARRARGLELRQKSRPRTIVARPPRTPKSIRPRPDRRCPSRNL